MLDLLLTTRASWAIGIVLLSLLLRFLQRLHFQRSIMRNLPGPPHNYLFGSLLSMAKVLSTQPSNAAPQTFISLLKEHYDLPDVFYFDPWPLGDPVMAIFRTDIANEILIKNSLPKHPIVESFMTNFGGPANLVSSEGKEWRKWRSAFNPGFSNSHLMTLVSQVVQDCQVFADIMNDHAKNNDLFRLEPATVKLTLNIIGRLVLGLDLNAQRGHNVLLDAFSSQIRWQAQGAQYQPSELWDIRRPIVLRYNTWKMNRYINEKLEERLASSNDRGKTKHVIDLALENYRKEHGKGDVRDMTELEPEFKQAAISNLKAFLFAGHDTTASIISYSYYYLSRYPKVMAKLRAEHEDVFGPDPGTVAEQLRQNGHLLNKLEYTLAVIKEVTRLSPPASTVRKAPIGYKLYDPITGEVIPTNHFMMWPVNVGMNRYPKYFPDPHVFNPERFLPGNTTDNKDAWMSFSKGPRNCIGQELAVIELKTLLALTIRSWDLVPAYDELNKLKDDGAGYPNLTTGVLEQFGERAYQVQLGTAKPSEGLPCRLLPRPRPAM